MRAAWILLLAAPLRAGEIVAVVEDSAGKPVEDAVVFVYEAPGPFAPPAAAAVMDQVEKEFRPRVLPVLAGTKVRFPNKDQVHHHIYSFSKAKKFDLPLYKGEDADPVLMDKAGIVALGCNIHDWMRGYVLVLDTPYYAMTGADGRATLTGVPEGRWKVAAWSERLKGSVDATLKTVAVDKAPARAQFRLSLSAPKNREKAPVDY